MDKDREAIIEVGEQVDLYLGKGPYYRTKIADLGLNGMFLVPLPTFRGIPIILRKAQRLKLFFYRDNGRFSIDVAVMDFDLKELRMVWLKQLTQPERQQRRESFRVTTMLRAILRPYNLGPFPKRPDPEEAGQMQEVPTFNISATGVAVRASGEFYVGERVFLRIFLAWPKPDSEPLTILGEIRQVKRIEYGKSEFQLGILFLDASSEMTSHIARFVLMEEQRRVKQQRLVEEE